MSLKILNLANNMIVSDRLNTGKIKLERIDTETNVRVEYVDTGNLFENLVNLQHLDLSSNRLFYIYTITFKSLSALVTLKLNNNQIYGLESEHVFNAQKNLQTLDLGSNKLSKLHVNLFSRQKKLTILNLEKNHLLWLDAELFQPLGSLIKLNLQSNKLKHLKLGTFKNLKNLRALSLLDNDIENWIKPMLIIGSEGNMNANLILNRNINSNVNMNMPSKRISSNSNRAN